MAVLSDHEIWSLLRSERLRIDPIPAVDAVQTSSVDLRLAARFTRLRPLPDALDAAIDTRVSAGIMEALAALGREEVVAEGGHFLLSPNEFALAWRLEAVSLPNFLCARVEGRSTLARLGLSVHQTAPTVHALYSNPLQLELRNSGPFPLKLYPGTPVCQLIIETMSSPATTPLLSIHQSKS
jgi:dCTP deaminase